MCLYSGHYEFTFAEWEKIQTCLPLSMSVRKIHREDCYLGKWMQAMKDLKKHLLNWLFKCFMGSERHSLDQQSSKIHAIHLVDSEKHL